jgi:hypothetical protein
MRIVQHYASTLEVDWRDRDWEPIKEEAYVYYDLETRDLSIDPLESVKSKLNDNFYLANSDLLESDDIKYLIKTSGSFFHEIHDILAVVLKIHKINPNAIFILFTPKTEDNKKLYSYFQEFFQSKYIRHLIVPMMVSEFGWQLHPPVLKLKNYVNFNQYSQKNNLHVSLYDFSIVSREILSHINASNVKPRKKVYLSRSHIDGRRDSLLDLPPSYLGYRDDQRMEHEAKLENFFRENGYSIIIPEQNFSTFREQLELMAETKVLAGVTGSGLTNALLMQDGGYVFEIRAQQVTGGIPQEGNQSLCNFYVDDAFIKNHTHISIPSERKPDEVIDLIKRSEQLFKI